MPDGIVQFKRTKEGLYCYKPSKWYKASLKKGISNLVTTVNKNKKGYTQRQYERAVAARALYHNVGAPTMENFKKMIQANMIRNNPITVEDVNIAENIFGPDISVLKGKSTRTKRKVVKEDLIEVPAEIYEKHSDLELCFKTMIVNGMAFLTSIDKSSGSSHKEERL